MDELMENMDEHLHMMEIIFGNFAFKQHFSLHYVFQMFKG